MRRLLPFVAALLVVPLWARAQSRDTMSEADVQEFILFNEIVPIAAAGGALDVSFAQGGLEVVRPDQIVWVLDPRAAGLHGLAARPIPETAKAGESLARLGEQVLRSGTAVHVRAGQDGAFVLTSQGSLIRLARGHVDSLHVATGLVASADVDANPSGLLAVLWGQEVRVFLEFGLFPFLEFTLEADMDPAVAVAVSARGEIVVAGRGSTAVAVYDLDADGVFRRVRSAAAADLQVHGVGGVDVTPFMLLPAEGREGWADQDRFVMLSDAEGGTLLTLEGSSLSPLGRWDLRGQMPGVSPGRFDVSNRGQIAFVDQRSGEAHVLPTGVSVSMVQGAEELRWRVLDQTNTFRVQGGDTLQLPDSRQ